jgi:TRAP-type mannitol/chloroaromatic compound transport system permease small subunit
MNEEMAATSRVAAWGLGRIESHPTPSLIRSPALASKIGKVVDALNALNIFTGAIAGIMLFAIAAMMGAEIVIRSLGVGDLAFSWEYSAYLMSASFFLAGGFTLLSAGHVRVTFLLDQRRPLLSYALELTATLIAIVTLAMIAWALIDLAVHYGHSNTRSYTHTATPLVVPTAVVALGAVTIFLQGWARLLGLMIGRADVFVFAQTDVLEG